MPVRTLRAGAALWRRDAPADSIAFVEQGRLAIQAGGSLVGVAGPGAVVGESALLQLEGEAVRRTADVVALDEPTVVSEYPATFVRDAYRGGTARLVLRTLHAHICRNVVLVMAASPGREVVRLTLRGLLAASAAGERRFGQVADWPEFLASFRVLYRLREATDALRRDLVGATPPDERAVAAALSEAASAAPDLVDAEELRPFLE